MVHIPLWSHYYSVLYLPTGWWHTNPSEKYEFVSWDDDIPNIWEAIKHVPNHQPVFYSYQWLPCLVQDLFHPQSPHWYPIESSYTSRSPARATECQWVITNKNNLINMCRILRWEITISYSNHPCNILYIYNYIYIYMFTQWLLPLYTDGMFPRKMLNSNKK